MFHLSFCTASSIREAIVYDRALYTDVARFGSVKSRVQISPPHRRPHGFVPLLIGYRKIEYMGEIRQLCKLPEDGQSLLRAARS